ncbi:hypothetical protein R6Z07M_010448 [Ovis aries]
MGEEQLCSSSGQPRELLGSVGTEQTLEQSDGFSVASCGGFPASEVSPEPGTFQRRLPLRAVSLNLGVGPSWKRLETPEPGQQGLQAAARSAKSTLGAMSQRIQESCQSGTKWLVETQVKARRRKRGAQKGSSPPARSLSQRSTRLSVAAPAHSTLDPREKEYHPLSVQMGPHAHPWQRSRREAAFRSPYSSAEPLCSPSESDSDLEPVGAGIRHLQKVSQELDEAIAAEDSGDMTVSLIRD